MHQGRLRESQPRGDVASHPEVRILVDGAGNQNGNFLLAEDVGKGRRQARRRLHCRESDFSNHVRVAEAENSFDLVERDAFLDSDDVAVILGALAGSEGNEFKVGRRRRRDSPHVGHAGEDESFLHVETHRNDVFHVLPSQSQRFLNLEILPQRLLVVGHLNHQRDVERLLQPPENISSSS